MTTQNDLITIPGLEDLTRREFLSSALAAAFVIACSDDDAPEESASTRDIDTPMGVVAVPVNPQRVFCLHPYAAYALLDVGVEPAGIPELPAGLLKPQYASRLEGKPTASVTAGSMDLEAIAALQPDLIVGVVNQVRDVYDQLRAIAPTVAFATVTTTANWEELVRNFSDAVNRVDALEPLMVDYRARAAAIREAHAATLESIRVAFIEARGTDWYLYTPTSSHGQVLAAAGVRFASPGDDETQYVLDFNYETIGVLDQADVVLASALSDGRFDPDTQNLIDQPVFALLPAARAGQVYPITNIFPTSYLQATAFLDELEAVLEKIEARP